MINAARLAELKDEIGEDDLVEVIGMFCDEVEEALESLETATGAGRVELLHFLKGSALNIGLVEVSEQCRVAEVSMRADQDAVLDVAGLRNAYAKARALLCASL